MCPGGANFIGLPFMCSGLSFVVFVFPFWCVQGGEFHRVAVHVGAQVCRFFRVRLVVCPGGVNFRGLPFMCSGLSFLPCSPCGVSRGGDCHRVGVLHVFRFVVSSVLVLLVVCPGGGEFHRVAVHGCRFVVSSVFPFWCVRCISWRSHRHVSPASSSK